MYKPTLFLSYNSVDRASVVAVQKVLEARGITTFLDRNQLVPGLPWPQALEEGLRDVRAVAVFMGQELGAGKSARCGSRWIGKYVKRSKGVPSR